MLSLTTFLFPIFNNSYHQPRPKGFIFTFISTITITIVGTDPTITLDNCEHYHYSYQAIWCVTIRPFKLPFCCLYISITYPTPAHPLQTYWLYSSIIRFVFNFNEIGVLMIIWTLNTNSRFFKFKLYARTNFNLINLTYLYLSLLITVGYCTF